MKTPITKILAMVLAVIMLVGMVPVYAFAASIDYDTGRADDYYKLYINGKLDSGEKTERLYLSGEKGEKCNENMVTLYNRAFSYDEV